MKHADLLTDRDRSDLEAAANVVKYGKQLRKQVFGRLRARAFRKARLPAQGD